MGDSPSHTPDEITAPGHAGRARAEFSEPRSAEQGREPTAGEVRRDARRKIRYAVVGLGYIAQAAVLPAFKHATENSELVALVSGDRKKLRMLARKYKVPKIYNYERYANCLASGDVDAVYIALPNNMHRAYTEGAARAGVHVLCEKPMAVSTQECEAMLEAAKTADVKLMVAYRLHFEKGNLSAIEAVQSGKVGEPRIFRGALCEQVSRDNSRLRGEVGGGPLYDVGVYCINAARYLFRAEPEEVFAWDARGGDVRFGEVEEMSAAILKFPGERLATFVCSFGAFNRSMFEIIGTKGLLKMDPAFEMAGDLKLAISVDGRIHKKTYPKGDQFGPELVYFSNCILRDLEPEPNGHEGMADVRVIEALLESQDKGKPVKLAPINTGPRPGEDQEMHKPPVGKPYLVKVAAPSE